MSAGAYTRTKYAASYGSSTNVHPIRVQPETLAATIDGTANDPPSADISNPISASISRNRNSLGLRARIVILEAPATGQPTGYKPGGLTKIPALTQAFFNAAVKGATCTYLGASFEVVSKSDEIVR